MSLIQLNNLNFSITDIWDNSTISIETLIEQAGLKPQLAKLKWIVEKAVHTYSMGGLTMQLEASI
ncbi:hypothetical protein MMP61_11745 [Acinetobacter sp. NIPH 1958]|uniref:hypothetical protein n=1 Tax=unclassified Acinetobacter TaxID=196816 RepID=UPI00039DF3AC|nr:MULTISPECIES: hypothetical protein [unclassified Acinetobacter]MCH7356236.1 hypothetical protein [Acinetobacter sp. NIPH 1958]